MPGVTGAGPGPYPAGGVANWHRPGEDRGALPQLSSWLIQADASIIQVPNPPPV